MVESFFCLGITISFFYNKLSAAEAKDILLNQAYATTRLNEIERGECEKFNNLSSAKQNFYRNYFKKLIYLFTLIILLIF